jgi:predicted alpha/beta-fold hydrolase
MSGNPFKPAWWLQNSHLQTIWPSLVRRNIKNLTLERERIELPDGDFIDLDWMGKDKEGPIVVILHGFEGNIESHYSKGMLSRIGLQGWRGVFMHFRGCSGEPNRLPKGYHSGDTSDLNYIINLIKKREPDTKLAAIGYSLGGNILLKWLGETKGSNPLAAAIAISVPFELKKAALRLQHGFSRFYQWYLIRGARDRLLRKFKQVEPNFDTEKFSGVHSMNEFDYFYTVPVHGFSSIDEYYLAASSLYYLHDIRVPTLIIHAKDDPFMTEDIIPLKEEISDAITLEVSDYGGHVGFITGKYPWHPEYWLEQRVPAFLSGFLEKETA